MRHSSFINKHVENLHRSLWDALLWKLGHYDDPIPFAPPPSDFRYPASPPFFSIEKPHAVWIGHSTYLFQVDGICILTDPVWDLYCSPLPIKLLRRKNAPAIPLSDLPPIDIVLISHNHYDHLDAKTVKTLNKLYPQIEWVVPEGLSSWFLRRGIKRVTELSWWKKKLLKNSQITAVPTQHFSGRGLFDQNRTHWNGYVIEAPSKTIYFVGDTGYNAYDFKSIGEKFSKIDLSLIPIGTYSPKEFMKPVHIGPYEAVQIHQDVNSRLSLGMHWNTFCLSEEPMNRPPYDLYLAMKEKNLSFPSFLPIDIGVYINF
jgi:N-acyl-phosphatidylethanolamine-hydrolysing phospholipase D